MTNKYGLDDAYFAKNFRVLARDSKNYTPDEMFTALSKLLMVAANQAKLQVELSIKHPPA